MNAYISLVKAAKNDAKKGKKCSYGSGDTDNLFCLYYLDMCKAIDTCPYKRRTADRRESSEIKPFALRNMFVYGTGITKTGVRKWWNPLRYIFGRLYQKNVTLKEVFK
jgi:hypothetical protein